MAKKATKTENLVKDVFLEQLVGTSNRDGTGVKKARNTDRVFINGEFVALVSRADNAKVNFIREMADDLVIEAHDAIVKYRQEEQGFTTDPEIRPCASEVRRAQAFQSYLEKKRAKESASVTVALTEEEQSRELAEKLGG